MRAALTIAGSDSSAGAGIQADLKTFAAFGIFGTSAVTAITAQNTAGVTAMAPLAADIVAAQMEAVAGDIQLHATKVGMLATAAIVEAVGAGIEDLDLPLVVLDPVLASSTGTRLLDDDGVQALISELLPRVRVVTPNIPEAEVLSGLRIGSPADARRAAMRIRDLGADAVIITGGHAPGDVAVDLLLEGETFTEFKTPRVMNVEVRGTGCTFAAAVAAGLALGLTLSESAERAQRYVAGAMAHAHVVGRGARVLDHFWERGRSG